MLSNRESALRGFEVRVRLFGTVELETRRGRVTENRSRQALHWQMLNYLLVNRHREVTWTELSETLWPERKEVEEASAVRVRLHRLRMALQPLGLDSVKYGLVLYGGGSFVLNPEYDILTDADTFSSLAAKVKKYPLNDPVGWRYCIQALELIRGPFLERAPDAAWLKPYRTSYCTAFSGLARDTLSRMPALEDSVALSLLCRRAPLLVPEDEALHRAVIGYMVEHKLEVELVQYVAQLSRAGAAWLERFPGR